MNPAEIADLLILAVLLPAWIAFGLADWHQHRRTSIETTSGWRESMFHLLLIGQAGAAVLLGLFFELNALVFVVALAALAAHEVTTSLDVSYAASRRQVRPAEQRVHDYLTALPLAVLALAFVAHATDAPTSWTLEWKQTPLPPWYVAGFLMLCGLNALAFAEELWRCVRTATRRPLARA